MARGRTRQETSSGGVVVRCGDQGPRVLLILDRHGNWGFPKGHIDPGETAPQTALREIAEETGLADLELGPSLGTIDWWFRWQGRTVHKTCHFFLVVAASGDPVPQAEEGIVDCRWCDPDDAQQRLTHDNARQILATARPLLAEACGG